MRKKQQRILLLAALTIIFMGSFLLFGSRTYTDTHSYEVMSPIREPVYGLLLKLFALLFGTYSYTAVGLIQNLLAIVVCFLLLDYIISANQITSKVVQLALFAAVLMPYVITPVFTVTKMVIANAMITEGIALSLYNLYFYLLLHLLWEKEVKDSVYIRYSVLSLLVSLLLTLTRGQMLVTMIAWFIVQAAVLLQRYIRQDKSLFWKHAGLCVVLLVAALGIRTAVVGAYNYAYNGTFAATPYGKLTMFTNLLYVSEREAGEKIQDEALQKLYYQIYDMDREQGMLYTDAPQGFSDEAEFFSSAHDTLKMDIIETTLGTYVDETYGDVGYLKKLIIMDDMAGEMTKAIALDGMGRWLGHYMKNILVGLVRSVALLHPLLYFPVLCGYLFLVAAGIYLGRKDINNKVFLMFLLVALLTAGTVGAVSLTIMCLSRYMIYNTSLIYLCGILLIWELVRKRKEVK